MVSMYFIVDGEAKNQSFVGGISFVIPRPRYGVEPYTMIEMLSFAARSLNSAGIGEEPGRHVQVFPSVLMEDIHDLFMLPAEETVLA